MESIFQINPELNIPIYQQMVDSVSAAIRSGSLPNGQKLPTVQEVSQSLNIARGTVKRAYDELEYAGLIQKVQGRGTFVCYRQVDTTSRKDQAMAAIDGVSQVEQLPERESGWDEMLVHAARDVAGEIGPALFAAGAQLRMLCPVEAELEELFMTLMQEGG